MVCGFRYGLTSVGGFGVYALEVVDLQLATSCSLWGSSGNHSGGFTLFGIHDLPSATNHCHLLLFADDVKMWKIT